MSELDVHLTCCLCPAKWETTIELPDGWETRYGSTDIEDGFCADHAIIGQFADSQCPGCVSGWGDCPLWQAFAYNKMALTDGDMASIERGVCPKRTNGTFSFSPMSGMQSMDLSECAPAEAGQALATAIRDYCIRYHEDDNWRASI